jgi:hypothetical protein
MLRLRYAGDGQDAGNLTLGRSPTFFLSFEKDYSGQFGRIGGGRPSDCVSWNCSAGVRVRDRWSIWQILRLKFTFSVKVVVTQDFVRM